MKIHNKSYRCQAGAVMVEVIIVGAFVLVPLFILTPILGKYIDTKQKVEVAARYAAWERTAWFAPGSTTAGGATGAFVAQKSNTQIGFETQARFFSGRDEPIHSEQDSGNSGEELDYMSYFMNRDNSGAASHEALFKEPQGANSGQFVSNSANSGDGDAVPGGFAAFSGGVVSALGAVGGFDLNTDGLYTSEITMDVKEPIWFDAFAGIDIKFSREHTLLADGWGAGGLDHNESLVRGLTLTEILNNRVLDWAQRLAGNRLFSTLVPFTRDVAKNCLVFAKVNADQVPNEVLGTVVSSRGQSQPRC
ncbi:MAG: hypothetical protein L3J24_12955 [Xanthomonadales bacterium]|nr:hypothetical protein [Xanthomonadales bacterium]